MQREKLGFDDCVLITPDDVSGGDFPAVPKKFASAALFNRKQKKIVDLGLEDLRPDRPPRSRTSASSRTSTATVTWKLTLVRKK